MTRASVNDRLQAIAELHRAHDVQLHRVVYRRGSRDPAVVEDACAYAWLELMGAPQVDLRAPHWPALGWLTTAAVRHAWKLERGARRAVATNALQLERAVDAAAAQAPEVDELVAQRMRLELVEQLPERPRRFLLRLALGYSYDEIAAAEGVSWRTTNKQIAKAKRLLRKLEAAESGGEDPAADA